MNVLQNFIKYFKYDKVTLFLIALTLSTLFIGYALSSFFTGLLFVHALLKANFSKLKFTFQLFLPILMYLLFCFTYFWSEDKGLTLRGVGRLISLLIVPFIFWVIPNIKKRDLFFVLDFFTKSNLVFSGLFLTTSYIRYLDTGYLNEFTYHSLVSVLDLNAIYVSIYFLISVFYLISKEIKKRIDYFQIAVFVIMLILLSSKVVIAMLFISLLVYLIINFKKRIINYKRTLIFAFFLIGIGSIFSSEIITRVNEEKKINIEEVLNSKKFGKVYIWTGASIRLFQLRILSYQLKNEKIFWKGFGLFASRKSLRDYHAKFDTYKGFHEYNYHNMYAQILSETGFFGLFILIVLIVSNFSQAIKSKSFIFIFFNILMSIWFLTESALWVHRGVLFFIIFYCLFNTTDYYEERNLNFTGA